MIGRSRFLGCVLLLTLIAIAQGKSKKRKNSLHAKLSKSREMMFGDDPLFTVETIEPFGTKIGTCECKCCEPPPAPLLAPQCENDIIVAVDSSACFRDHHRRMKQFLQKLVGEIHRNKDHQFGVNKTRLAIMQFSSDQIIPVSLDSFDNYQDPASSKRLKGKINEAIAELGFLGQGAYLNQALNATVAHFLNASPRPYRSGEVKRTVIVLTNGKSHPDVTFEDVQRSVNYLHANRIKLLPVSVTRQCYSSSPEWDEGLCPDVNTLKLLGEGSYTEGDDFLPMRMAGTVSTVVNEATECPAGPAPLVDFCNTCNCSCELPIGPRGLPGDKGVKGDTVRGPKGEQGPQGDDGEQGPEGPQGIQGPKGTKGTIGPRGAKGDIGPEGIEGRQGLKGEPGEEGPIGDIGPRGPQGEVGAKGDTGEKGDVGRKGSPGEQGVRGEKGHYGDTGPIGPSGPKGEPGIGIKGTMGETGEKGDKGDNGTIGVQGLKGPKGDRGLCGKPGPAGLKGNQGIAGQDGANGQMGETGIQGPRGPEGLPGAKGNRGEPGLNGEIGPHGDRGPQGPEGPQGPRGPPGINGVDSTVPGPRGPEGQRGPKGERGADGADGEDGIQGPTGAQGPRGLTGQKGEEGRFDPASLRPLLVELIRELLPGECVTDTCTEHPVDLVFMIDGSDSIDRDDFSQVQDWILKTVDRFNPADRTQKLHVDVVQFSEQVRTEVHQIVSQSSDDIRSTIEGIQQMRSGTKTYRGLRYVNSDVTPNTRQGAFKMLVTMTDGDASEERDQDAVATARQNYDLMLAVGIGEKIHTEQLEDFTHKTDPISVGEFASLGGVIDQIVDASCKNIKEGQGRPTEEKPTTSERPMTTRGPKPTLEGQEPTPPPYQSLGYTRCADSRADIAFLIDGSSSVGNEGFELLKSFLHDTIDSFEPTGPLGFRMSIIQYTDTTRTELSFEESVDKEAVLKTIKQLQYLNGDTRTGNALDNIGVVFEEIRTSGNRIGAPQIAVVVTDGRSQDDVIEPAQALQEAGVTIFAIGVTATSLQDELSDIASSSDKILTVTSYDVIDTIKEDLLKKICASVRGSYIVYDATGNSVEQILFGDDDEDISRGDDRVEASGSEYDYAGDDREEDMELQ